MAFARYATAQVAYHEQVVARHQIESTGCCRFCGRVWPCDQVRRSRQMIDHFSQWAPTNEQPLPTSELVRPHVSDE